MVARRSPRRAVMCVCLRVDADSVCPTIVSLSYIIISSAPHEFVCSSRANAPTRMLISYECCTLSLKLNRRRSATMRLYTQCVRGHSDPPLAADR